MKAEEPGYRDWQGWDENPQGARSRMTDLPSRGSAEHAAGTCRPCAWFHKPGGCRNDWECSHCHLCPSNAKRKKGKGKGDGRESRESRPDRRIEEEAPDEIAEPERPRWSRGSEMHGMPGQKCRPCLLLWTPSGCREGEDCEYCHICVPEQFAQPPPPPSVDRNMAQGGAALSIQLADRIVEPPSTVVLGTAPVSMRPMAERFRAKVNSMNSHMQMGVLDSVHCSNCGENLCICFPGGYGFSQQRILRAGEANGRFRNGAGDLPLSLQSLRELTSDELPGQENEAPEPRACGSCTPCLEMMSNRSCSAGDSCQYCHQCVERRKIKKIGNKSLKKSSQAGDPNMWL